MPRTLAAVLRPFVSLRSRTRGEAYVRQGRVSIVHSQAHSVSARVRGSRDYEVSLVIDGQWLTPSCDCPFFDGTLEPCKHAWALALAADRQHLLAVPPDLEYDSRDLEDAVLAVSDTAPPAPAGRATHAGRRPAHARAAWETFLDTVPPTRVLPSPDQIGGELLYVFDPVRSTTTDGMYIELLRRQRRRNGEWARPRDVSIARGDVRTLPDRADREILERVCGATDAWSGSWNIGHSLPVPSPFVLTPPLQRDLAPRLCETGRLRLRIPGADADAPLEAIAWDADPATFRVVVTGAAETGYRVTGVLDHRGRERPLHDVLFVTGVVVLWRAEDQPPTLSPLETAGAERWLAALVGTGEVAVPPSGATRLLEALATSGLARVSAPDDLRVETHQGTLTPLARVRRQPSRAAATWMPERLTLEVGFRYGDVDIQADAPQLVAFDRDTRTAWRRDLQAEHAALGRVRDLGARDVGGDARFVDVTGRRPAGRHFDLAASALPAFARALLEEGWKVEADGRAYRKPGATRLGVSSGIDWFELRGQVDYGDTAASLPAILAAVRRGETFVTLDDGSVGLLPDEWLGRSARIAALGQVDGDGEGVRFQTSQAALLDAWLAEQPEVSWDEPFARLRTELAAFAGVTAQDPPPSFTGALREYQREALGWFAFLRRFGFGGCLADEMGLGKTVMVLAALDARRLERERNGAPPHPSIIVVPRSLVFNWLREAARFAPALRMLDATGAQRRSALDDVGGHDVVMVTYGTLRRDIGRLKDVDFDYAILDEAQAIKNASTASARAARLLRATHRLALSGTPVENHLGELWSLFDFLNPGLFGSATTLAGARTLDVAADDELLSIVGRGLRPFILRRTKEQVASELPPRTEQTIYCDLEPAQRKVYDGLRAHYRASLLGRTADGAPGPSTLHVLEALLRLRQAACHPGLVDPTHAAGPSAKLDVLLPRLQELVEDGRKVLVFSQFTSLLALLRTRLDESGLTYEYLDGRTRNREARVHRFQEGPCPLFLISLKAGGLGLNLTAAEYVFLLDPWWNPAVEAQAIDRAHRIGQTRAVFAWRLIARDTVEEKVLELQAGKRRLADAVVRADASLLRELKREDLELLLS